MHAHYFYGKQTCTKLVTQEWLSLHSLIIAKMIHSKCDYSIEKKNSFKI